MIFDKFIDREVLTPDSYPERSRLSFLVIIYNEVCVYIAFYINIIT